MKARSFGVLGGALAALLGGFAPAQTSDDMRERIEGLFSTGEVALADGASYGYRLLSPPEGAATPEGGWPLVVFLHGAGERGDDNRSQLAHFPVRMAGEAYRERFPCYLLAVQCPEGSSWSDFDWRSAEPAPMREEPEPAMRAVMQAVENLVAEEPIDLTRIYLTGLSMGGFGSWDLAARRPEWFAAVAPICGGGDADAATAYKGLPIWAWHDEGDPVVPVELSRRMVKAAEGAGAIVRYEETKGHGHASWEPAYETDQVPAWMFEQRRMAPSPELVRLRDGEG